MDEFDNFLCEVFFKTVRKNQEKTQEVVNSFKNRAGETRIIAEGMLKDKEFESEMVRLWGMVEQSLDKAIATMNDILKKESYFMEKWEKEKKRR